jgi:Tol biopolymer transport system component
MNCEQVKELLSAYLDDTLAQEERLQVATHLQNCAECSAILADFRRFDALLTQLPRISAPPAGTYAPVQSGFQSRRPWIQRSMLGAIAAAIVLTMGVGSFIFWHLLQKQGTVATDVRGITPPAGLSSDPIPAGLRFVFLRDGALWSAPTDGGTGVIRLTPENVTVADNWIVRAPYTGHPAGNLIAYIDLQQGYVHTIRSDGQSDTVVPQPLLKSGSTPSAIWNTETGIAILNSLSWSKNESTLTFIADPEGTGQPGLYLYSPGTGQTHQVQPPIKGAISDPIWGPDGVRIAFKLSYNGKMGILDYNTNNNGVLTIAPEVSTPDNPHDTVLSLGWSPDTTSPTITWSTGVIGHVHGIWSQHVGVDTAPTAFQLASGDYVEATYSRSGNGGTGSWLLITSQAGLPGDVISLDLTATSKKLTNGKQVSFAQWSPDGTNINYFDQFSSGSGTLHVISSTTGNDTVIANDAASLPAPTWSGDGQRLAYSTGSHVLVASVQTGSLASKIGPLQPLKLQGVATALSWSVTSPHQLVLAIDNGQVGIYLVDTQRNTSLQLDKSTTNGPIQWTQIP